MKKILLIAVLAIVGIAVVLVAWMMIRMGPRNFIGMLRYDQRKEGHLKVGDRAPDAQLVALDGRQRVPLLGDRGGKPLVLVFGSFT
ncbi:MAG TPA: hypothetical protein VNA69_16455 [Thermoanaerobaculia bacterium]|nr:hypothetical protein [Thermoanaerobaculia bacterium]